MRKPRRIRVWGATWLLAGLAAGLIGTIGAFMVGLALRPEPSRGVVVLAICGLANLGPFLVIVWWARRKREPRLESGFSAALLVLAGLLVSWCLFYGWAGSLD